MGNPFHSFLRFFGLSERISNKIKSPRSRVKAKSSLPELLCRQFSLHEIRAATSNFDPNLVIGRGGSVVVYKGFVDDGTLVAFKRLMPDWSRQKGLDEFRNEVQLLCQLHHQNLVSLIGFCYEKNELILVYEHMSKGSLYDYLHGTGHDPLSWKQRLEICVGAAGGLHYLHTGAKRAVIHRDINTKNILLDNQWVSKLSDFGLSKIGPFSMSNAPLIIELPPSPEESMVTMKTGVRTYGYLDPEFFINPSLVTDKSDVYSFGVVLFEVLCGRKAFEPSKEVDQRHIISWVSKCLKNGTTYHIIDPYLKGKIAPSCLEKFLEIAFSCISFQGNKRPALGEVEATLELALELQNKADSKMKRINPHDECVYGEVSFQFPISSAIPDYAGNISEHFSYSDTCSIGGYLSDSDSSLAGR